MIKNFIKISLFFYTSMIIANVNDLSIDNMSLNEKIAQMIMVRVRSDYYTQIIIIKNRLINGSQKIKLVVLLLLMETVMFMECIIIINISKKYLKHLF